MLEPRPGVRIELQGVLLHVPDPTVTALATGRETFIGLAGPPADATFKTVMSPPGHDFSD